MGCLLLRIGVHGGVPCVLCLVCSAREDFDCGMQLSLHGPYLIRPFASLWRKFGRLPVFETTRTNVIRQIGWFSYIDKKATENSS